MYLNCLKKLLVLSSKACKFSRISNFSGQRHQLFCLTVIMSCKTGKNIRDHLILNIMSQNNVCQNVDIIYGKVVLCMCINLDINSRLLKNQSFVLQHHTAKAGFTALPGQSWCVRVCRHASVEVCICV